MGYKQIMMDEEPTYVVCCDYCGTYNAIGLRDFHEMPHQIMGAVTHLCPKCYPTVRWCHTHLQYHKPTDLHRQPCVDCGGLFTSTVQHHLLRCPSCRRAAGEQMIPTPKPRTAKTFFQQWFG
jgi:protein-arginine kinase activator protein McsA